MPRTTNNTATKSPTARKRPAAKPAEPKVEETTQDQPKAQLQTAAVKPKREAADTIMTPMEPPAKANGGGPGAKPRYTDEVAQLKSKPNEWFLFQKRPNILTANSVATGIRTGKGLAAFRGAKWEVVVRGTEIFVKYLGEKDAS